MPTPPFTRLPCDPGSLAAPHAPHAPVGAARLLLTLLLSLAWCGWAIAHELGAEIHQSGERIDVVAYFDDDTPAIGAKVTVTDANGKVVLTGKTDKRGLCSFIKPRPGVYQVDVDGGDGHKLIRPLKLTIAGDPNQPDAHADAVVVSDGPSREEFTRTRWEGLLGGLVTIGLAGLLAFVYVRSGKQQAKPSDTAANQAADAPKAIAEVNQAGDAPRAKEGGGTDPSGDSQTA
jgi:hypothetical protein